jgi:pimeloyl-ACP methyl ester carboxylesterase
MPMAMAMRKWLRRIGVGFLVVAAILALLVASQWKADIPLEQLKARWAPPPSRFLDLDGMSVHYRDEGTGPAVVLLHGTGSSLHTWDAWASALGQSHRVIRMDLPAFGLTGPRPDADYRIDTYVDFVQHFVARLGVDHFALAGSSLGGDIAWRFAAAHPSSVDALVLVDAGGYPRNGSRPLVFRLGSMPVVSTLMSHLDPRPLVARTTRQIYGDPSKVTQDVVDRYCELSLRAGNRAAFGQRTALPFEDRSAAIAQLRVRTLVVWGDRDPLIPVAYAHRFAEDIPEAKLRIYEGLGHVPMEEDGPRTAADVVEFLRER